MTGVAYKARNAANNLDGKAMGKNCSTFIGP